MRIHRIMVALAAVTFASAACADAEPDTEFDEVPPATETTPPGETAAMPDEIPDHTVAMEAIGGSTLTGEVDIDDDDGRAEVDVRIANSTDGAVHQGHIHTGTCEAPGAVVQALEPVTIGSDGEGTSENDLELDYATVTDGQHIVVFHQADGSPGAPALCVPIPSHQGL